MILQSRSCRGLLHYFHCYFLWGSSFSNSLLGRVGRSSCTLHHYSSPIATRREVSVSIDRIGQVHRRIICLYSVQCVCITHIQQQWYSFKIRILWRKLEHNFNHSERIKPWRTFEHFKVKSCSNAKAYGAKSTSAIPQRNLSQRVAARLTRNTISLYSSQSQQQ